MSRLTMQGAHIANLTTTGKQMVLQYLDASGR